MNMDFDSPSCGACEQIVCEIPVVHKITGNEVLGTFKLYDTQYHLKKQTYSNSGPFYHLEESGGWWAVNWGNSDKDKLIKDFRRYFHINDCENPNYETFCKDAVMFVNDIAAVLKNKG